MGDNLVITGGAGFVGQWLQEELRHHTDYQGESWDTPEVDITDPLTFRARLEAGQPRWVVHLAALSAVGHSWDNAPTVERVNVEGTRSLLQMIEEISPQTHVVVASTADIYGGTDSEKPLAELPLREARPVSPYAKSKWAMEEMIETAFNDRCVRVRPFPHIGPGQRPGFVTADFASQIAAIESGKQEPVIKVGNLDAVRDFTDVRDVVRAYRLLLEQGKVGEVYHIASGTGVKIADLLEQLLSFSAVTITVERDQSKYRPLDTPVLIGDASKLKAATGWQPEIPLEKTLKDTLDWWRGRMVR